MAYEQSMILAHQHTNFSVEMLKGLSAIVMKNTGSIYNTAQSSFDASKGDLRLVGVTAGVGGRSYMNYMKVPSKLEEFCKNINIRRQHLLGNDDIIAKYLLSFEAHYQLVTIHPWVDGNGRMARLIMNHLQYELGLLPVKIFKEDKAEYIQALVDSQEQESYEPFNSFMLKEHIQNLKKEIEEYIKTQAIDPIKTVSDPIKERLIDAIKQDNSLNYAEYGRLLGVSEATIKRRLSELKKTGIIIRKGSNKTGHWEIKQ